MDVLVASQTYQSALEATQLEHGVLTHTLMNEALSEEADRMPTDGVLTFPEIFSHTVASLPAIETRVKKRVNARGVKKRTLESIQDPVMYFGPRGRRESDAAIPLHPRDL
jgi:hypothetical protein